MNKTELYNKLENFDNKVLRFYSRIVSEFGAKYEERHLGVLNWPMKKILMQIRFTNLGIVYSPIDNLDLINDSPQSNGIVFIQELRSSSQEYQTWLVKILKDNNCEPNLSIDRVINSKDSKIFYELI